MANQQNISEIKELINKVVPYTKKIILFGSQAKGNYNQDSDYDVLVIVYHNHIDRRELIHFQAKIKRLCAKIGIDADIIIRDSTHADAMKHFPGNIIHSALQSGVFI